MQATVLFADISGAARLAELGGRAVANKALAQCLQRLSKAARSTGGKVVKSAGGELMAVFRTPERAARGAAAMHATIDALPAVGDLKLGVHIGFHSGPVIAHDADLLGDTVKLAARLLEEAQKGETLTSRQTAVLLGSSFHRVTRRKAIDTDLEVCEIGRGAELREPTVVQLTWHGQLLSVSREVESVVIGRERGCGLVVADRMASRRHCTVKLRDGKFLLQDHSSNGTLVSFQEQAGVLLKGRELVLHDYGVIVFGPRRFQDSELVQFQCN